MNTQYLNTLVFWLAIIVLGIQDIYSHESDKVPHETSTSCKSLLSSVNQSAHSFLKNWIEKKFEGIPDSWEEGQWADSRQYEIRNAVVSLSVLEKASLLSEVKRRSDLPIRTTQFLLLALNDANAWLEFFHETTAHPTIGIPVLGDYRILAENVTLEIRSAILKEVGKRYWMATKEPLQVPELWMYHFPKRSIDAWIRVLVPADQIILETMKQRKSSIEANQVYLDTVRAHLLHDPALTSQDLLKIGQIIQNVLKDFNSVFMKRFQNASILLYGSTLKGLARSGADLDLIFSPDISLSFQEWMIRGATGHESRIRHRPISGMTKQVEDFLEMKYQGFKLSLDRSSHTLEEFEDHLSYLSPTVIEIRLEQINLLLFSHETIRVPESVGVFSVSPMGEKVNARYRYTAPLVARIPYH